MRLFCPTTLAVCLACSFAHAGPFGDALAALSQAEQYQPPAPSLNDFSAGRYDPPPIKLSEDDLPADAQPTPWPKVGASLNLLQPKPNEVLVDFGCGYDARFLIAACRYYDVKKAIGIEIDPIRAESARIHVSEAGLEDRIEIITGDATKVDVSADVGFAYLWPETLAGLKPKIESLERFVSFSHEVPGLVMSESNDKFYWQKREEVAVAMAAPKSYSSSTIATSSYKPSSSGNYVASQSAVQQQPRYVQQYAQAPSYSRSPSGSSVAYWDGRPYSRPLCNSPTCAMCNGPRGIRAQLRRW